MTGGRALGASGALLLGALALGATGATAIAAAAEPAAGAGGGTGGARATATAHVIYLTGGSVYIDAGREQGIAVGDTARVTRGSSTTALLRVAFVSSSKASCDTIRVDSPVRVGDAVRYAPGAAPEPIAAAPGQGAPADSVAAPGLDAARPGTPGSGTAATDRTKRTAGRRARPVRGRVGVGLLTVPAAGGGPGYTQPSLTLRMDGAAASGAPLDFSIDVRGHRTYRAGDEDGAARVYRLSTALRDAASTRRLSVGRQALPVSSSASLIDGALAQLDGKRVSVGVFSGLEPAPGGYDFSADIVQSGGFLQWRNAPGAAARWTATGGFVDSRHGGAVNRDFAFGQGTVFSRALMLTFSQEIDLNPAWKRSMGEPSLSFTSTFATARVQLSPRVTANGGFDNRRNVRLLRDRETPETEFDDRYRQGGWMGATVEPVRNLRLGGSARVRSGGATGAAWTYSGSVEAFRLTSLRGSLRARTARVTSDVEEGWLHSFGLDATLWAGARAGLTVGTQRFTQLQTGGRRLNDWQSVNVDLGLARRWYVLLSAEHDRDDAGSRVQSYSSLNWMF